MSDRRRCAAMAAAVILGNCASLARASEADALAISAAIQARHLPFGTILDPIYASSTSSQIIGYTRCGDSALWTGAYLAAEAFRYKVTLSADALHQLKTALAGLKALTDVTGDNRLARCMAPAASPYAAGIGNEEASNTVHSNPPWIWVDNTTRDEVVGANASRDTEMAALLDQWLQRPKRDFTVDVSKVVPVCGNRACQPVPVALRPPADFLWQRDPFQLSGGGAGIIEGSGVDYILPYWMGRYYGVIGGGVQSAAAPGVGVAANSLASLYGANLSAGTAQAASQPLPPVLGGVSLAVTDAAGTRRNAPLLYVSPSQINFVIPDGTLPGPATFVATAGSASQTFTAGIQAVAPALFSMNGAGTGVAAATAAMVPAGNPQLQSPVQVFQCAGSTCAAVPIRLGIDTPVYLSFYGTGIRNRSALTNVSVTINGVSVPVLYAGPAPNFAGLDQVNVALTLNLRGSGESKVVLAADGQPSNPVTINVQ